jgi:gliding motility-associated-like protein
MKWLAQILIFLYPLFVKGQNLIVNPSLEDHSNCNISGGEIFKANGWFSPGYPNWPSIYGDACSPDYLNSCSNDDPSITVPLGYLGFQHPYEGNGHLGLYVFSYNPLNPDTIYNNSNGKREYATVLLEQPLNPGTTYCLSFYISFAESSIYAIDKIGAYFSTDTVWALGVGPANYLPQIQSENGVVFSDTSNWIRIDGEFVANGGERYMTVGNFNNFENTTAELVKNTTSGGLAYYYFDMFTLDECKPQIALSGKPLGYISPEIIYPNVFTPNKDGVNDVFKIENLPENIHLTVYNRWGAVVYSSTNYQNNWDGDGLSDGVYYYILSSSEDNHKKGIITILR